MHRKRHRLCEKPVQPVVLVLDVRLILEDEDGASPSNGR